MSRILRSVATQLGPAAREEPRASAVARMIALMVAAQAEGCDRVAVPAPALTTFFPRRFFEDQAEVDALFETAMLNPGRQPLFDRARALGIAFTPGCADNENGTHFNAQFLVDTAGRIVNRYRNVHLPSHHDHEP